MLSHRIFLTVEQWDAGLIAAVRLDQATGPGTKALFVERSARQRAELIGHEAVDGGVVGVELAEFGRHASPEGKATRHPVDIAASWGQLPRDALAKIKAGDIVRTSLESAADVLGVDEFQ